jgi:hypothetical protein
MRPATELTLFLKRRPGTEHARAGITFAEYDIAWPDGRPVQIGLSRFCNSGARLLLGRRYQGQTALVRLTIYPIAGLEAALTCPFCGARCRRFYALRRGDCIRLHFLDGTPTETVFDATADDPRVLRWLQAEHMRSGEPFWFDMAGQTLMQNCKSLLDFEQDGVRPAEARAAEAAYG